MSNEYEQLPEQDDQDFGYQGDHTEDMGEKSSSGLIRAGIIGVVIFLAIIGMASVINNWFRGSTDVEEKLAVIAADSATDDGISPYRRLEKSWVDTRALLEAELQNKRALVSSVTALDTQIETAKQSVVKAENSVTVALQGIEEAQNELDILSEKASDLESETPQEAFEDAQLAASAATEAAAVAQEEFQRAKAEQARIEATVAELRRAASAADAAANASRLVVSAADAAKLAVTENQDVMSEADEPTLSNLENNFFKDAEQQAVNMERSAKAARQAVEVAERRLASLKQKETTFQEKFAKANALETEAKAKLKEIEKQVEAHLLRMQSIEMDNATAETKLIAAKRIGEERQEELKATKRDVAVLEGKREAAKKSISAADDTLEIVEAKFQETEVELKKQHRIRAERNAVSMATLNANLNEKLRGQLSGAAPDHPIFDRLVFSSAKLFEQGSANLDDGGKEILLQVVPVLTEVVAELPEDLDWVLRVDGHTDIQPISGTGRYKDNWELSQARALSVVRFLVDSTDLLPEQMSANGYGEYQPLTDGTSPISMAKNRRIELTLAVR